MAASERGPVRLGMQASVHATEEVEQVQTAIENLFPPDVRSALKFKTIKLRGHYHNPIIRIETQLTKRDQVEQTVSSIGQMLATEDRERIANTFAARIDQKGQIFLRLDKQEAFQGQIRIVNRGDSIRLVIRFSGRKPTQGELEKLCRLFKLI